MHDASLLDGLEWLVWIANGLYKAINELFKVRELVEILLVKKLQASFGNHCLSLELTLLLSLK